MKGTKTNKGITLIALIITIVVLLILAAVAISSITNDGILHYAQNASDSWNQAQKNEQDTLISYEDFLKYQSCPGHTLVDGICSKCGYAQCSTGHTYGNWVVTVEADCDTEGSKESTCSVCGMKGTETIPFAHQWEGGQCLNCYQNCEHQGFEYVWVQNSSDALYHTPLGECDCGLTGENIIGNDYCEDSNNDLLCDTCGYSMDASN